MSRVSNIFIRIIKKLISKCMKGNGENIEGIINVIR